jgi:hypothetical protein
MWRAENLLGFIAAPDLTAQATDILTRMVSTFQWTNSGWHASADRWPRGYRPRNEAISKIIADTAGASSRSKVKSHGAVERDAGVEDVVDEHTDVTTA